MSESSLTILSVLLVTLVALAGGRVLLRTRAGQNPGYFRFTTALYLVLGLALGGQGFGLAGPELLHNLEPVKELALGWIGLLFGLQLRWTHLRRFPAVFFRVLLLESGLSLLAVGGALWLVVSRFFPEALEDPVSAVAVLAALGAVSSPTATALAAVAGGRVRHRLARLAHFTTSLDPLLPLVLFALAAGYRHPAGGGAWAALEWVAASVLLGLILGLLFYSFARHRHNERELTLLIIAFAVFAGGVASYLALSSLFVTVVLGSTLTNLLPAGERVFRILVTREKPILILLLVLTGADWRIGSAAGASAVILLLAAYLVARSVVKTTVMALASRARSADLEPGAWRGGLALLGQGGMSVALLANCQLLFQGESESTIVTVGLLAVICAEFFSARAARAALFMDSADREDA
ncbi:cation:proton antiporter [bacterium]|nr:cation:proton antiporter [bacterium]